MAYENNPASDENPAPAETTRDDTSQPAETTGDHTIRTLWRAWAGMLALAVTVAVFL